VPDIRPILLVLGILLTALGLAMLVPALLDWFDGNPDWMVFAASAVVTLFMGGSLWISNFSFTGPLTLKQAFVLTTSMWVVAAAFGAIPFRLAALELSTADAFFEAMSGLTTTGSTVIEGLDMAPRGILIWRALLQWMGGVGIIVTAVAILPMLQIAGMQLFRLESSDTSEKILPRAREITGSIAGLYVLITFACYVCYRLAGMMPFDAIAHSMTTIATAGYSTHDLSLGFYNDKPMVHWVAIFFMLAGSLPFVLYLLALNGKTALLFRDAQVRAFLGLAVFFVLIMAVYTAVSGAVPFEDSLRHAAFNVVSVMTGTGYASTDYNAWGPFAVTAFFFIMFFGGCAGSTTCGIKIFRFQVMAAALEVQIKRILYPHGVFIPRFGGRPLNDEIVGSVMSFFFLFFVLFAVIAGALSFTGEMDAITAFSAAGTAITNVGPGLGPVVGPAGSFAPLSDAAKWLLSAAMLLGRLELFTVLVLFSPGFWRR
jgi:trk system potassium uptake protein